MEKHPLAFRQFSTYGPGPTPGPPIVSFVLVQTIWSRPALSRRSGLPSVLIPVPSVPVTPTPSVLVYCLAPAPVLSVPVPTVFPIVTVPPMVLSVPILPSVPSFPVSLPVSSVPGPTHVPVCLSPTPRSCSSRSPSLSPSVPSHLSGLNHCHVCPGPTPVSTVPVHSLILSFSVPLPILYVPVPSVRVPSIPVHTPRSSLLPSLSPYIYVMFPPAGPLSRSHPFPVSPVPIPGPVLSSPVCPGPSSGSSAPAPLPDPDCHGPIHGPICPVPTPDPVYHGNSTPITFCPSVKFLAKLGG